MTNPSKKVATVKGDDRKWYLIQEEEEAADRKAAESKAPAASLAVPKNVSMPRLVSRALRSRKGRRGGGASTFKTVLWERIDVASSANTAYSTAKNLQPKNVQDWSSIVNLFDSCRCLGVRLHHRFWIAGGTASSATIALWAFDPGTSAALTSVVDGLTHEYNSGPISVGNNYGTAVPNSTTSTGMLPSWRAKTAPNFESGLTSDLVGSNYFPATGSVAAIVGYLMPYFEAGGSGVVVESTVFIGYELEFRYRH